MRTAQERGGKAKAPSPSFLLRLTQIDRASPLGVTERRRLAWGECRIFVPDEPTARPHRSPQGAYPA
ncbi:hypothetical protein HMPREF1556_00963 [Porphyromonas sp. oral taxon 278 str. W7784]|nr:hypothetical protein HMPREF1556_00963 [Porphyromonas sp. oral taxon 278 str. W7784]